MDYGSSGKVVKIGTKACHCIAEDKTKKTKGNTVAKNVSFCIFNVSEANLIAPNVEKLTNSLQKAEIADKR